MGNHPFQGSAGAITPGAYKSPTVSIEGGGISSVSLGQSPAKLKR